MKGGAIMILKNFELLINAVIILSSLLAVVYTLGVVWRVEKKLDLSYKLFLVAILAFAGSVIIETGNPLKVYIVSLTADLMRMLFAIFFLAGVYTMRSMIRRIDGEKKDFSFPEKQDTSAPH